MPFFSSSNKKNSVNIKKIAIESLVGPRMVVEGDIAFKGGLRIDGLVKGNIHTEDEEKSLVVISEKATVEGEVKAANVIVSGCIMGPVTAYNLLELQPGAKVHGDVWYQSLEMHTGSVVVGMLHHDIEPTTDLKLASNNE